MKARPFVYLALIAIPNVLFAQAPAPVVVMSSYHDDVAALFEQAFEEAYPSIDLQMLWRSSSDAIAWLEREDHAPIDVYWAPAPRIFSALKEQGRLATLSATQRALPQTLGATQLSDPDGYYVASEVAGFGFVIDSERLQNAGLATPHDWQDLANPKYAGMLALPVPSIVSYASPMIDIVLQAYGWQEGWRLWSEIAGNANLIRQGSTFVIDEVATGRSAIGLSIDFYATVAIANGNGLDFIYPQHGGLNPAHIAMLREGQNPEAAANFVDFILSKEGQMLLTDPNVRKLPVRPDVYATLSPDYHNVFAAADNSVYNVNNVLSQARTPVLMALFDQMFIIRHEQLQSLWHALHAIEARGVPLVEARKLLSEPLISEREANDLDLQALFATHSNTKSVPAKSDEKDSTFAITSRWLELIDVRHRQVAAILATYQK